MPKHSNVEVGQRREAVLSLLRKKDTAAAIARRYQVSEPTLYRWRDKLLARGEAGLSKGRGKADARRPKSGSNRGQSSIGQSEYCLTNVSR